MTGTQGNRLCCPTQEHLYGTLTIQIIPTVCFQHFVNRGYRIAGNFHGVQNFIIFMVSHEVAKKIPPTNFFLMHAFTTSHVYTQNCDSFKMLIALLWTKQVYLLF